MCATGPNSRLFRQQSRVSHLNQAQPFLQPHTHPMVLREPIPHVCHQLPAPKEAPVHQCHTGLCRLSQLEAHRDNTLWVLLEHPHLQGGKSFWGVLTQSECVESELVEQQAAKSIAGSLKRTVTTPSGCCWTTRTCARVHNTIYRPCWYVLFAAGWHPTLEGLDAQHSMVAFGDHRVIKHGPLSNQRSAWHCSVVSQCWQSSGLNTKPSPPFRPPAPSPQLHPSAQHPPLSFVPSFLHSAVMSAVFPTFRPLSHATPSHVQPSPLCSYPPLYIQNATTV